jgi:hypothetical protein
MQAAVAAPALQQVFKAQVAVVVLQQELHLTQQLNQQVQLLIQDLALEALLEHQLVLLEIQVQVVLEL